MPCLEGITNSSRWVSNVFNAVLRSFKSFINHWSFIVYRQTSMFLYMLKSRLVINSFIPFIAKLLTLSVLEIQHYSCFAGKARHRFFCFPICEILSSYFEFSWLIRSFSLIRKTWKGFFSRCWRLIILLEIGTKLSIHYFNPR